MERRTLFRKLLLVCIVFNLALISLVEAQSITSMSVYPVRWTRLQGDSAIYYVNVQLSSYDKISLSTQNLPPSSSAKFNPSSGWSVGVFSSTLTVTTKTSTPTGIHSFNIIVTAGNTRRQLAVTLKVVPRTIDGASLVLYDSYAKYLSSKFWTEIAIFTLSFYTTEFVTSLTNPLSLLKNLVLEAVAPKISVAEELVRQFVTLANTIHASSMSYILGMAFMTAPVALTSEWEVQPLVEIASLIERGDKISASNKIRNFLSTLRQWLNTIEKQQPDGLVVTANAKNAARNLVLSCINFLEAELIRLQPDTQPPSVRVIVPNGGETLIIGKTYTIRWQAQDNLGVTKIDVYYSVDGGKTWRLIAGELRNIGSYNWKVPNTPSNNCLIRVDAYDSAGNRGSDTSDRQFTVRR